MARGNDSMLLLSSSLANFLRSSAAGNAEHRIVLDNIVGAIEHELHAAEIAKGAPAAMDVWTNKIARSDRYPESGRSLATGSELPRLNAKYPPRLFSISNRENSAAILVSGGSFLAARLDPPAWRRSGEAPES
jgi:hypothetical protein